MKLKLSKWKEAEGMTCTKLTRFRFRFRSWEVPGENDRQRIARERQTCGNGKRLLNYKLRQIDSIAQHYSCCSLGQAKRNLSRREVPLIQGYARDSNGQPNERAPSRRIVDVLVKGDVACGRADRKLKSAPLCAPTRPVMKQTFLV